MRLQSRRVTCYKIYIITLHTDGTSTSGVGTPSVGECYTRGRGGKKKINRRNVRDLSETRAAISEMTVFIIPPPHPWNVTRHARSRDVGEIERTRVGKYNNMIIPRRADVNGRTAVIPSKVMFRRPYGRLNWFGFSTISRRFVRIDCAYAVRDKLVDNKRCGKRTVCVICEDFALCSPESVSIDNRGPAG